MESWQRDGLAAGDLSSGNNRRDQNKNDNVQEFKDLFATGMEKITQSSQRKQGGIDLTYNPGDLPPHKLQKQLSLFDDNPPASVKQQPSEEMKMNPFEAQPEQFGQMQFHEPLPASEVDKAKANIDSILDSGMDFQASRQVDPVSIDTSNLFNYAGMDTNRTN